MANPAEKAFIQTFLSTLSSQPVTYKDDYQQPLENWLPKVPVLPTPVPPVPQREHVAEGSSSSSISVTFKSSKPPASYTIPVFSTDTISSIKAQLAAQASAPPADVQRLLLKGKALADAKLLKEYSIKDGDTINLMVKPGFSWDPNSTSPAPSITPSTIVQPVPKSAIEHPAPTLTLEPAPTITTGPKKHQRIPSVVLSPSPSNENAGQTAGEPITLDLDTPLTHEEISTYHEGLARPELWDRLLAFAKAEFSVEKDAQALFEDFLLASKNTLTAHEIARIRDHVGVIGMAGT